MRYRAGISGRRSLSPATWTDSYSWSGSRLSAKDARGVTGL